MEDELILNILGALFVGVTAVGFLHYRTTQAKVYSRPPAKLKKTRQRTSQQRTTPIQRYHSVSVVSSVDDEVCEVSRRMRNKRFLASNAPPLPLPGCDAERCPCVYQHHTDRRKGGDRRHPFPRHALHTATSDRRASEGRRESDFVAA